MDLEIDYDKLVEACDTDIRIGQPGKVKGRLKSIVLSKVPRSHRLALAQICRRSGLTILGLRLLSEVVRGESNLQEPASPMEVSEYGVLLSSNGSTDEAIVLLKNLDAQAHPTVHLHRGFCEVTNWNLSKAATHFEEFLKVNHDPYQNLVAMVNLAASRVYELDLMPGLELVDATIAKAFELKAFRLLANCYELRGQILLRLGRFSESRLMLNNATRIFDHQPVYDELFVRKWHAVLEAMENNDTRPLQEFRQEAIRRLHWDSVREADLFLMKMDFDQSLFDHLYYGTRFKSYRDRISRETGGQPSPIYFFGDKSSQKYFDIAKSELSDGKIIKAGRKVHMLLEFMCRDFYSPLKIGSVFSHLYPEEYFDAQSTPFRVRQLVNRFREWCKSNAMPLDIKFDDFGYRLHCHEDFSIKITLNSEGVDPFEVLWRQFSDRVKPLDRFEARQGQTLMGMPRATFHRFLAWTVEVGRVSKTGSARSTRYFLNKQASEISKAA